MKGMDLLIKMFHRFFYKLYIKESTIIELMIIYEYI